jgi:DNA-binding CsgD family transcriptional regulator
MQLRADYVRLLLRLVGESLELRGNGSCPYTHFLTGLARIAHAEIAIKITASDVRRDATPIVHALHDSGWPTPADRDRVYAYVTSTPLGADPLAAAVVDPERSQVTLGRADVMSATDWAKTEVRNDIHRPSGVDDSLLSIRRRDDGELVDVFVLKREWGAPPFGDDERTLLDLVQSECAWLFNEQDARPSDVSAQEQLTRRERQTLALLLSGDSEKGIAATLGLSPHTVHQYVGNIYRKTGVASRAELMASAMGPPSSSRLKVSRSR